MTEPVICKKCMGRGFCKPTEIIQSNMFSSTCKRCGFQALGMTQVRQFEKRGGYCRQCSGDFNYV